jgi:hypothetical protein
MTEDESPVAEEMKDFIGSWKAVSHAILTRLTCQQYAPEEREAAIQELIQSRYLREIEWEVKMYEVVRNMSEEAAKYDSGGPAPVRLERNKDGGVTLSREQLQELAQAYQHLYTIVSDSPAGLSDYCETDEEEQIIRKWRKLLSD